MSKRRLRRFVSEERAPEKLALARKRRKNPTAAERHLWQRLKARGCARMKFRREAPILGWFADFYCPGFKLVVEIDGGYHNEPTQASRDAYRDRVMRSLGLTVLRFTNEQVLTATTQVLNRISGFARERRRAA